MVNVPRLSSTVSAAIWGVWNSIMYVLLVMARPPASAGADACVRVLLRVQLDDELLLHRRCDLVPLRMTKHLRGEAVVVRLEPRRDRSCELGGVTHHRLGRRAGLHRYHVVGP